MTTVKDILAYINAIAPFDFAESWDNSGLQVGNPGQEIKTILVGLDVSMALVAEAARQGADLIITHHPLLISPVKCIDFTQNPGNMIYHCVINNISIISAHTNLDIAAQGLNDYFAERIGICSQLVSLSPTENKADESVSPGIGRIGELDKGIAVKSLAQDIKKHLDIDHVRVIGDLNLNVSKIAVCTGSGGSLMQDFIASQADVYITGDMKYHEARLAEEHGKAVIDVGHFASEHMAIDLIYERLTPMLRETGINIVCFKREKDPFIVL